MSGNKYEIVRNQNTYDRNRSSTEFAPSLDVVTREEIELLLSSYYTASNLQTPGGAQVHWLNITNTPTTVAGYGITDVYTITQLQTSGQSQVHWGNLTNVPDPTITLTGGVTGSGTMTNLGSTSISCTVANDSHTHDTRYYTESELNISGGGGAVHWNNITNVPGGLPPGAHATSHQSGGSDQVNHDLLVGFVANEHIDHSTVSISAGGILSGGGTIAANRTITLSHSGVDHDQTTNFVANEHINHGGVSITAGAGLTGGGTIEASRTINVGAGTGITVAADVVNVNVSSTSQQGIIEIATSTEAKALASSTLAITPSTLGDVIGDVITYIGTISAWNMDTTSSFNLALATIGTTISKIREISVVIYNDSGVGAYDFISPYDAGAPDNGFTHGSISVSTTNVTLYRRSGGFFDDPAFDTITGGGQRGYIVVRHAL